MTAKIDAESLGCSAEDFSAAVSDFVEALNEYEAHLVGVRMDEANPRLAPEDKRVAFPGPHAPPIVMAAIRKEPQPSGSNRFIADYELTGPSLEVQKQRLSDTVAQAAQAAMETVTPARKRMFFNLTEQAIRATDERSADDEALLADQDRRRKAEAAIKLQEAKAYHDIDDLTEETIGQWKMETFGG
jgi:hypothetical protein